MKRVRWWACEAERGANVGTICEAVAFGEIAPAVRRHLARLPSAIDSFLEAYILTSRHYRIVIAGAPAGFASINESRLIAQFALDEPYRRLGQSIFAQVRRLE
jgi:hypothetical protein